MSANYKIDSLRHELLSLLLSSDRSIVPDSSSVAGIDTMGMPQEIDTARPELVALQHAGESIDEARKALRYRHFPTIAGDVGFRYGNPGLNMGMDQFMGWGIVGLTASWNLFDGFKSRAQDAQLQRQLDYIDIARTRALETMRRTFEQARMQLNSARGRLTACQASEAAAAALAGERKNQLAAGAATSTDYLNALTDHAQSRFQEEAAKTAIRIALLELRYAAGADIRF